ncbi:MAG: oligopeptide:H+ symporter [Bacteroidota bacterium]
MSESTSKARVSNRFLGQPKGLFVLYLTEMQERLSFYGMKAILFLFLTAKVIEGGWHMDKNDATLCVGIYGFLVYVSGIPAGWFADRYIGSRKAVLWGAILQTIGHVLLGITSSKAWFVGGIAFLSMGTGLLKTNISSMVGQLYTREDASREKGFSFFYQGINVGAIIGIALVPAVKDMWGYHAGFMAAGIGMGLSLFIFIAGSRYLPRVTNAQKTNVAISLVIPGIASLILTVLFLANRYVGYEGVMGLLNSANLLLTGVLVVLLLASCIYFFYKARNQEERNRMAMIFMTCIGVVGFIAIYLQCDGFLTSFAKEKINRNITLFNWHFEIGPDYFQILNPIFIILFSFSVVWCWKQIEKAYWPTLSPVTKIGVGLVFIALDALIIMLAVHFARQQGTVSSIWLVVIYLVMVIAEICVLVTGLSFVSKMAPTKFKSTFMGILWGCISLGSLLSGQIGSIAMQNEESAYRLFGSLFLVFTALGLLYICLNQFTYRLTYKKIAGT